MLLHEYKLVLLFWIANEQMCFLLRVYLKIQKLRLDLEKEGFYQK